jgi:AcrR family transcriptional regulator
VKPKARSGRSGSARPNRPRATAGTAKRKRRSSTDILNRIVRAAADEFSRCGFTGAATAAIARKAGVTEAQLFRYFGSKSNLFRETVFNPLEQHLRQFLEQHASDPAQAASVRGATQLYTTELQRFIREHSPMLRSLLAAQIYDSGTSHGLSGIDSLATYFDRGAAMMTNRLKSRPPVDPRLMVRLAFAAVLACVMFKDWIIPAGLVSDEELTEGVNLFVMEGVGANTPKT